MKYNLKRVLITLDVLIPVEDEDTLHNMELGDIVRECYDGQWSLRHSYGDAVTLKNKKECQKACDEHDTDLDFFFIPD
jgi:hypothetical protein